MTEQFKEEQNNKSTKRRKNSPQIDEKELNIKSSKKHKKKYRELGTWANKGTFTEVGDGKITLEEFFGVKSLDEIEPLP